MIILTTSTSPQRFVCIPRTNVFNEMILVDDQTNESVSITDFSINVSEYYTAIEAEYNLVENHYYDLTVLKNSSVIFKDRILCTNQNIADFSVNNGEYVSNSTTNTFILYE